jgi:inorganic phosphate transporter, PiT family
MLLLFAVIFVALIFEFLNGFHDTANSVSCSVGTKVLTPNRAIALAATMNLCGALAGTAVATTMGKGLVQSEYVTGMTLICGLGGAILWNLITWLCGLPSSSSHALIGGLVGAAIASAGNDLSVVIWSAPEAGKLWYAGGAALQGDHPHVQLAHHRFCGELPRDGLALLRPGVGYSHQGQLRFSEGATL